MNTVVKIFVAVTILMTSFSSSLRATPPDTHIFGGMVAVMREDPETKAYIENASASASCLGQALTILPELYDVITVAADHNLMGILEDKLQISIYRNFFGQTSRRYEMAFEYDAGGLYTVESLHSTTMYHIFVLTGMNRRLHFMVDSNKLSGEHIDFYIRRVDLGFAEGAGLTSAGSASMINRSYSNCRVNELYELPEDFVFDDNIRFIETWFENYYEFYQSVMESE